MTKLEDVEKRRAALRDRHDSARKEQEVKDLEAILALEEAQGEPLHTMTANGFKAGVSVKVAFRAPTALEYKRFCDMVGRAQQKGDSAARQKAQEVLADVCWEYPAKDSEERKKMLDAFPGVLISMAIEAAKVAELASEEEGKG